MSNPCLEAVRTELDSHGIPYNVETGGKHVHIRYGRDYEHLHVVAATPSDWRAPLNERALIRREIAANGLIETLEPEREIVPVHLTDGEPSCFSYDIAENFAKAHKDVLRVIDRVRDECGPEFDRRNFTPIDYQDAKGRKYRAYRLTRDGFSLVVMGFTGSRATEWKVKYIDAFNCMAQEIERLRSPDVDLTTIRSEMDALISIVGDVEARISSAPVEVVRLPRMSRAEMRKLTRRLRRRGAA